MLGFYFLNFFQKKFKLFDETISDPPLLKPLIDVYIIIQEKLLNQIYIIWLRGLESDFFPHSNRFFQRIVLVRFEYQYD